MADKKMYAWGNIIQDMNLHPRDRIKVGQVVSASDFADEDEFNELVGIGAIRSTPYPIPANDDGTLVYDGSPREYALAQIAEMDTEQYLASVQNTWTDPQLDKRARKAMEESGYDPGSEPNEEEVAAQDKAEKGQESRQALEAQAGKGKGPQLGAKRTSS